MSDRRTRHWRNYLLLFGNGLAMGAADVVPGVSGGTIAFISGIYDELVESLRAITPANLLSLFRQGPAIVWKRINGGFLLVLVAGILTSIFSLAQLVVHVLEHYPLLIWSFFFGLILASIYHVLSGQRLWQVAQFVGLLIGTLLAAFSAFSPPVALGVGPLTLFGAGALAICAMILPGISGSFILALIGMYPVLIGAVAALDFSILAVFACGAVLGLLLFSHSLFWLLHHHRATTLSVMIGFMVGSLPALWPWRIDLDPTQLALAEGFTPLRQLLMPDTYAALVADPRVGGCMLALLAGVVLVLGLEYLGRCFGRRQP